MPVEIPVGLPSTLIERRPDVRMAEEKVRGANAEIGVAIGDFFPRIGLTAFYGGTSTELNKLVSTSANTWSAAASAAGPLFTGGRLTGRYRQTKAACEEAKLEYQQTALSAFREVSDALISRRRFEEERAEHAEAVDAGRKAVAVATDRYKEGKASYYEVLEAQQQLFPAENALSRIEAGRRLAVNLQVALAVAKVIALGSHAASGEAAEKHDALVRAADSLIKQADKMKEISDMGVEIQKNGGALIQKATTAEAEIRRQTREIADAAEWLRNNHGKQ
jgi:outer membrane protein TolC